MLSVKDFSVWLFPTELGNKMLPAERYVSTARHMEQLGFRSVSIPQLMNHDDMDKRVMFDPLMLVPIVAATTTKLRIGLQSACLPYLHPYHWARFFASLDVMTGGRVEAGMALGYYPEDFDALGVPMKERGARSDEAIQIIKRLWTEDRVTYQGRFYQLKDARVIPKPVQKPHPPIWWGGNYPGMTRAARYCDIIYPWGITAQQFKEEWMPRIAEENKQRTKPLEIYHIIFVHVVLGGAKAEQEAWAHYGPEVGPLLEGVRPEDAHAVGNPERVARLLKEFHAAGVSHFGLDFNRHGEDPLSQIDEQMELFVDKVLPLLQD